MSIDLPAVGVRVRAARELAGLTQRGLQARTGVSQSMVHRLETGKLTGATIEDLDRLAVELNIPLDELLYGSAVEERILAAARTGSGTRARTGSGPGTALTAALRQAIDLLKLDDTLDAVVPGMRQQSVEPALSLPASRGRGAGQAVAGQVRDVLDLGNAPVADVAELAGQLTGIDVGATDLPPGVAGVCATDPERATCIVLVNTTEVAERQRFTLAHELAHVLFGDSTHVDQVDGRRSARETLCDEFARHLLIPEDGVRAWLKRAGQPPVDERVLALVARHYGVSPAVARIQLDRMGLLPGALRTADLPGGRRFAYRYGWGPQYDSEQAAAGQPRPPRRIVDRATEAYRTGQVGIGLLARLQELPVRMTEQALDDAGVVVQRPAIRHADIYELLRQSKELGTSEELDGSDELGDSEDR